MEVHREVYPESRRAADLLGVPLAEADRLFVLAKWPDDLYQAYVAAEKTGDSLERKRMVLARMDLAIGEG